MNFITNCRRKRNIRVKRENRNGPMRERRMYRETRLFLGTNRRFMGTIYLTRRYFTIGLERLASSKMLLI
jgi:hypothetical protein